MNLKIFSGFVFSMALFGLGCATVRTPALGLIYTDVKSSMNATANQSGNRIGEACASSILGLVATGDASIEAARRNGGITLVSSVDEEAYSILGIYGKYCTIVRGR